MFWHLLFGIAHLVVALSAINVGLVPSGNNVCANQSFLGACGQYMTVGSYVIGVCGVICLLHILYKLTVSKCCKGSCGCESSRSNCSK